MAHDHPPQLLAHAHERVQRLRRILKDDRDTAGAKLVQHRLPRAKNLFAFKSDAAVNRCALRQQAENCQRCLRFARSGLSHQPDGLACPDSEAQSVDGSVVTVADRQAIDLEQAHGARLASKKSRSASPRKLKHSKMSASNAAGISSMNAAPSIWFTPASTREPSDVRGSWIPSPRKLRNDSTRRDCQRDVDDDDADQVRRDVAQNDPRRRYAGQFCRRNELPFAK